MNQSFSDDLASQPRTIKAGGGRRWIHPAPVHGKFARLRLLSSVVLLAVLIVTPWVEVGGLPFIRLSFLAPSFFLFGHAILIYEFYHFVLLALLLVVTLFGVSALWGRVWCGYACPQTVFVEQLFGRIETLIEGPAAKRILAEGKPLTAARVARKALKQLAFVTVSAGFAFSLVAWFTGPREIFEGSAPGVHTAVLLLTALAWFDGAYWREQFCHIVCPYGRFQSIMQDRATRTIGYDARRGEPRGKGKHREQLGDCIDCGLCVRVCPSGIDIRQGASQLECIACTKCIDACDGVMTQTGKTPGLIRYDAVAMFSPDAPAKPPRIFRRRLVAYAGIWLLLCGVGIARFVNRAPFHAKVLSAVGSAPYFLDGDRVKNLLALKVGNQSDGVETYEVTVEPAEARIESPASCGPLPTGSEGTYPLLISAPRSMSGKTLILRVRPLGGGEERVFHREFVGPDA